MKSTRCIQFLLGTIIIALFSCSAVRQNKSSPTTRLIDALQNGKNFMAIGETFDGDILLEQISSNSNSTYITSELFLKDCIFSGNVNFKSASGKSIYFDKEVILEGCDFKGEFKINDATFSKRMQLCNNLFRRSLDIQRNSYLGTCRIDENDVGQDLIIQYSKCHEDLSLFGNTIGRHLSMQGISVLGKSQLGNTTLSGSIDVSSSHFHEDFNLDYAKNGKKILAGNSKFYSRCYIKKIDGFTEVDLSSSQILGKYLFSSKNSIKPNNSNTVFHLDNKTAL